MTSTLIHWKRFTKHRHKHTYDIVLTSRLQ